MFSVIIPLYNKELSITNTIQSVLNQTFQDFEIVVVNDGSTDKSVEQVKAFDDPRIRIIDKPNGGVSSARNRGIEEAKYEWIAFLDGDDLWERNHLEEVVQMINLFPNDKVFTTSFEYSDGRKMFKHPRESKIFKIGNYFKEALKESLMCSITVVIHKSCFDKVGGFNPKLSRGEDLDVWARLAREYDVVKSQEVTAVYRVEAENRAVKTRLKFGSSIISTINLGDNLSKSEELYKRKIVIDRLKILVKEKNFISALKALVKHNFKLIKW